MMVYQSYQFYQTERPKTAAEIRRADEQLSHMAEHVSWLWRQATRPLALLRRSSGPDRGQACSALLDTPSKTRSR